MTGNGSNIHRKDPPLRLAPIIFLIFSKAKEEEPFFAPAFFKFLFPNHDKDVSRPKIRPRKFLLTSVVCHLGNIASAEFSGSKSFSGLENQGQKAHSPKIAIKGRGLLEGCSFLGPTAPK